jgi:RNA polymerase sigma-70 factor, ECF subfamily
MLAPSCPHPPAKAKPLIKIDAPAVAAFRRRDSNGVHAFYRQYGRLVYALAHRVLRNDHLAEEATQQTFVRAWAAADRLDPQRDPAPWLATIAKRVAIDLHRRESRRTGVGLDEVGTDHPAVVTSPADLETVDAAWRVRQAIDQLPAREAVVIRLHHLDGLTHHEIAARLGLAVGTVKSRSHRAHAKLAISLRHLRQPVAG